MEITYLFREFISEWFLTIQITTGEQPPKFILPVNWRPRAFRNLGPLVSLLDRCLELNPSKRPTMGQVVMALHHIANGCS